MIWILVLLLFRESIDLTRLLLGQKNTWFEDVSEHSSPVSDWTDWRKSTKKRRTRPPPCWVERV